MNAPFATYDMHAAPLSEIDDGYNDIIILRAQNSGRCQLARMLLSVMPGDYFTPNGEVRPEVPLDYLKVKKWELRPRTKVPFNNNNNSMFNDDER